MTLIIEDLENGKAPYIIKVYVKGCVRPFNYTDPRGEWFGLDDLAALIVGAVIGAVSNVVSDLVKGDFNVGDLIGDSILGAVSGAVDVELQHNGIPVYISMNTRGMSAGIGFGGFCGGFTAGVGANASWDGSGSYGVSASVGYGAPGQAGFGLSVGEQHTNAGGWTTNVGAGLTLGNGSFSGSVGASATFGSDGFEGYGINAGITGTNTKGDFAGASISSNFDKNGNFESTGFGLTYGDTNKKGDSLSMTETMTVDKDNKVSLSNSYSASLDLRQNAIYNGNKNFGGTGSTEYYNKDTLAAMQNTNKDNFDNQHALYQQGMLEQRMTNNYAGYANTNYYNGDEMKTMQIIYAANLKAYSEASKANQPALDAKEITNDQIKAVDSLYKDKFKGKITATYDSVKKFADENNLSNAEKLRLVLNIANDRSDLNAKGSTTFCNMYAAYVTDLYAGNTSLDGKLVRDQLPLLSTEGSLLDGAKMQSLANRGVLIFAGEDKEHIAVISPGTGTRSSTYFDNIDGKNEYVYYPAVGQQGKSELLYNPNLDVSDQKGSLNWAWTFDVNNHKAPNVTYYIPK